MYKKLTWPNKACISPGWERGAGQTARCGLLWYSRSYSPGCGVHPDGSCLLPYRYTGADKGQTGGVDMEGEDLKISTLSGVECGFRVALCSTV